MEGSSPKSSDDRAHLPPTHSHPGHSHDHRMSTQQDDSSEGTTQSAFLNFGSKNVKKNVKKSRAAERSEETMRKDTIVIKEAKKEGQKTSGGSGGESSSDLGEKTCQSMAIDLEEMDTQEESAECKTGMEKTVKSPIGKTKSKMNSFFEVVVDPTKDVPPEMEIDSVKRLSRYSRESMNLPQPTAGGSRENLMDTKGPGEIYLPKPAETPKMKKKRLEKEKEVREWNARIAEGHVFRPRKDDETIDEVRVNWN